MSAFPGAPTLEAQNAAMLEELRRISKECTAAARIADELDRPELAEMLERVSNPTRALIARIGGEA